MLTGGGVGLARCCVLREQPVCRGVASGLVLACGELARCSGRGGLRVWSVVEPLLVFRGRRRLPAGNRWLLENCTVDASIFE